jgi:simple sugar transport system ATP-binding protein
VIYQDFALFPNMTIAENIMMYSSISGGRQIYHEKEINNKAEQVIKRINFDTDVSRYVYELTVAEKQMVSICRALVVNPKLLIMDEPTTALTSKEVNRLFEIVLGLKDSGVSILFVSHKLDEIYRVCDCVTIMRNGKAVFESVPGEPIPNKDDIIFYMTGHNVTGERYSFNSFTSQPLLKVDNYQKNNAFYNISFSLYEGEVLGITGLLGCGRSELAESLFGITPADSGNVTIQGKSVGRIKNVLHAMHEHISYLPDDRLTKGLFLSQSIYDNSIISVLDHYASRKGVIHKQKLLLVMKQFFHRIQIPNLHVDNAVQSLSGGNQQKVVLIKWLATNPKILILNCPTVGVDVGAKSEILGLVKQLASDQKIGVIVISDDAYEILQVCNRVLVMSNGSIVNEVDVSKIPNVTALENIINLDEAMAK